MKSNFMNVYIEVALENHGEKEIHDFIEDVKAIAEEHCGFIIDINKL